MLSEKNICASCGVTEASLKLKQIAICNAALCSKTIFFTKTKITNIMNHFKITSFRKCSGKVLTV